MVGGKEWRGLGGGWWINKQLKLAKNEKQATPGGQKRPLQNAVERAAFTVFTQGGWGCRQPDRKTPQVRLLGLNKGPLDPGGQINRRSRLGSSGPASKQKFWAGPETKDGGSQV